MVPQVSRTDLTSYLASQPPSSRQVGILSSGSQDVVRFLGASAKPVSRPKLPLLASVLAFLGCASTATETRGPEADASKSVEVTAPADSNERDLTPVRDLPPGERDGDTSFDGSVGSDATDVSNPDALGADVADAPDHAMVDASTVDVVEHDTADVTDVPEHDMADIVSVEDRPSISIPRIPVTEQTGGFNCDPIFPDIWFDRLRTLGGMITGFGCTTSPARVHIPYWRLNIGSAITPPESSTCSAGQSAVAYQGVYLKRTIPITAHTLSEEGCLDLSRYGTGDTPMHRQHLSTSEGNPGLEVFARHGDPIPSCDRSHATYEMRQTDGDRGYGTLAAWCGSTPAPERPSSPTTCEPGTTPTRVVRVVNNDPPQEFVTCLRPGEFYSGDTRP